MVGYSSLFVSVFSLVTKNIEQRCEERNRSSHFLPFFRDQKPETTVNTKNLLDGLKNALLGFFNDLLGRSLQQVVGQALAPLAGIFGGGAVGGGGIFGNIFRTPGTFAQSASGGAIQNLVAAAGGGIGVPASVTAGASGTLGGLPIFRGNLTAPGAFSQLPSGAVIGAAGSKFSLSGFGNAFAAAAPFLGASIGGSLGGQSIAGQIAGAAGGFLGGGALAATLTTGVFSKAATAFLTNPFTIAAGVGLLVGSIFLGRAKQRRQDEELSGQYLTQAVQATEQLAAGVRSGQIDVSQARTIFDGQILGTFRQQISSLKTASVRESRLTNQVRDLEKMYRDLVEPAIAAQIQQRRDAARFSAIDSRLIPEFAGGGYVGGIDRGFDSVKALLRPGELVLNRQQQNAVISQSNSNVFRNAGVPSVNMSGRYDVGGYAPSGGGSSEPIIIYLDADVDAEGIFIKGGSTKDGRRLIVNHMKDEREYR